MSRDDGEQDLPADLTVERGQAGKLEVGKAAQVVVGAVAEVAQALPKVGLGHLHIDVDHPDRCLGRKTEHTAPGYRGRHHVEHEK